MLMERRSRGSPVMTNVSLNLYGTLAYSIEPGDFMGLGTDQRRHAIILRLGGVALSRCRSLPLSLPRFQITATGCPPEFGSTQVRGSYLTLLRPRRAFRRGCRASELRYF